MIFTPLGQNGTACQGVEAYALTRPAPSEAYTAISWTFFGISCILWGGSILPFWMLRNHPRFKLIRPFFLSLVLCLCQVAFAIGISLNIAIPNLPCVVLLFGIMLGFSGFGINYFVRLLIFSIQGQFTLNMEQFKMAADMMDKGSVGAMSSSRTSGVWIPASLRTALISILRLIVGVMALDQVSFAELFIAKNSYGALTAIVAAPGFITTLVSLIVVEPNSHGCMGCAIFLELFIGFMVTLFFYILLSSRILYVVWKLRFPDAQESVKEFAGIVVFVGTTMALAAILIVVDPDAVEFNRLFAFEWIFSLSTCIYWWLGAGMHFVAIANEWRRNRLSRIDSTGLTGTEDYMSILAQDEAVRQAFTHFVVGRYAVENLYFAQDVLSYKRFFFEKASNWRHQKATFLFNTYLKPNSVMEVNISHAMQSTTIKSVENAISQGDDEQLVQAFDSAYDEITIHVLRGMWQDFVYEYRPDSSNRGSLSLQEVPSKV